MTRIIGVIGGKGGIGKTTLVSNLSCSLASLGYNVVAIDANMTTPNLGLHLGLHLSPRTLHDVLKGRTKIQNAIYKHSSGFNVVPGNMATSELQGIDIGRLPSTVMSFYNKADFVILDSAAGLGREALSGLQSADEILLITNPDLPSVADAMKTMKLAEEADKKVIGVVLNKVSGEGHELSPAEIEEMIGYKVVAQIPHDKSVPKSIANKIPVFVAHPESDAAVEFGRLAHALVGKEFARGKRSGLAKFFRRLMRE